MLWDSGKHEVVVFTGMQNEYHLVSAESARDDHVDAVQYAAKRIEKSEVNP